MQKMTPAILTGTVFGLLQSFGLPNTVPVKIAGGIFCIVLMWFITHSAQI